MKKIFYSFLLFAVALVSTAALVSCGGDDEEDDLPQTSQASLDLVFWISEDLQKIADIKATGISTPLSFTNKYTLEAVFSATGSEKSFEGLASQSIRLEGDQAKNANIKVTFELKPNWKEIIAGQEEVNCRCSKRYTYKDENGTRSNPTEYPEISDWGVKDILADKATEDAFVARIARLSVGFSGATY